MRDRLLMYTVMEFRMRDLVSYECANLHPMPLKGKCHIFCSHKAVPNILLYQTIIILLYQTDTARFDQFAYCFIMLHYTIIDFNEVDIRIYQPEKVIFTETGG